MKKMIKILGVLLVVVMGAIVTYFTVEYLQGK